MYSYTISKEPSNALFLKTCKLIENNLQPLKKDMILVDVDGTCIQKYHIPQGIIKVFNDFEMYALYVDSDIDLSNILREEL